MTTDWVKRGIIVTTGTFSKQACEHISKNGLPIELIDGQRFKEIAASVGYELFFGYDVNIPKEVITPLSDEEYTRRCFSYIDKHYTCSPCQPSEKIVSSSVHTGMRGMFRVQYRIKEDFYNSKKDVLIYSIDDQGTVFLQDGTLNTVEQRNVSDYLAKGTFVPMSEYDGPQFDDNVASIRSDVEYAAYREIVNRYTCDHNYVTTNNQYRTKHIVPAKKSIEIYNIVCVFVPFRTFTFQTEAGRHVLQTVENGDTVAYITPDQCDDCDKTLYEPRMCSLCGKVVCNDHAYSCSICNRTLCRGCTMVYTKALVLKKPVCTVCARNNPKLKAREFKDWE